MATKATIIQTTILIKSRPSGSDLESFFSAVVSSAAGLYAVVLIQNAGITTLLTVRPGQSVAVTGDPSLPQPPDW